MKTLRAVLAVAAGGAFGCGVAFLIHSFGSQAAGVAVAVIAAVVVVVGLVRYEANRAPGDREMPIDADWFVEYRDGHPMRVWNRVTGESRPCP